MKLTKFLLFLLISLCGNSLLANDIHELEIKSDYFSKKLDVTDYLGKINTSSIPERLLRTHLNYTYNVRDFSLGMNLHNETGNITRSVEPLEIENQFTGADVIGEYFFAQNKKRISLILGVLKQKPIILDCVQRANILLGGNCIEADFRLLDGDVFNETNESKYLSVLESKADSVFVKSKYTSDFNWYGIEFSTYIAVDAHKIEHQSDSPLFKLESPFLLNSDVRGKTLAQVIDDLQAELPQKQPWYDMVIKVGMDMTKPLKHLNMKANVGVLYSEKIQYESVQSYKENFYLTLGFEYYVAKQAKITFEGTGYLHYLQGIQPILYTPKTAKYFAHPYAELSLSLNYKF